jgi:hypothetical protein
MISQNIVMTRIRKSEYSFNIIDSCLDTLFEKHGGNISVKIDKPVTPGSNEQNKLMHALMTEFFLTGMHSSPAKSIDEFKLWLKCQIGVCYDYEYQGKMVRVPKSWSLYSKIERMKFIDNLISMVIQSGAVAEDEKIQEILNGLDKGKCIIDQ